MYLRINSHKPTFHPVYKGPFKVWDKSEKHFVIDSGVQRSGDARSQLLDCMPPPKLSSTQECDKDRHLKYVKASVEKKISKI